MERKELLKGYCVEKLASTNKLLNDKDTSFTFAPNLKIRLMARKNILSHLIEFNTCYNFASTDDLENYIENNIDVICGFYDK